MRVGVNTWVWVSPLSDADLKTLVPHIKGMGFDWIEVPIEGLNDFDYASAAKLIADHGLGVSVVAAMSPDRDLIHSDSALRDNGADYIRHCVDAAHTLGAASVAGPLYSAVGRVWQQSASERETDITTLVGQLRPLAEYAATKNVTLCLEPLNRFETSFINLTSQAIEVIDRVDHPNCQLLLDTFHMNIEERSLGDAIRAAGKRVKHIHACENDRGAPGSGHVPWQDVAGALKDIQYDGAVVIESFTSKVKSIARAAAIWRPFADSQDDLARNGGAFLRSLLG
jgi:D-psicose/D-tagatose/L-ribulose 3-epimerase